MKHPVSHIDFNSNAITSWLPTYMDRYLRSIIFETRTN